MIEKASRRDAPRWSVFGDKGGATIVLAGPLSLRVERSTGSAEWWAYFGELSVKLEAKTLNAAQAEAEVFVRKACQDIVFELDLLRMTRPLPARKIPIWTDLSKKRKEKRK